MASHLPPFPRFVFQIFEPISLVAGVLSAFFNTPYFISAQLPPTSPPAPASPPSDQTIIVAHQLGNLYLLSALLALFILNTRNCSKEVLHSYLYALAIADVGHVAASMWGLGWETSRNVRGWNDMAWGNVGVTCFLFATRCAYLAGWFGKSRRGNGKGRRKVG